jgi:hypothetical protein
MNGSDNATAGMIRLDSEVKPEAGNSRRCAANNRISMIPTQNCGIPCPASDSTETTRSVALRERRADSTPSGKPTSSVRTIATAARDRVAGSRPSTAVIAGLPSREDWPKSSRTVSPR